MTTMLRAFCRSKAERSEGGGGDVGCRGQELSLVEIQFRFATAARPCRGQVDQDMLELFAYGHNHHRLRGKRADKAPIELLTEKS